MIVSARLLAYSSFLVGIIMNTFEGLRSAKIISTSGIYEKLLPTRVLLFEIIRTVIRSNMCDSEDPIDPKSLSTAFKFAALAVLLVEDPLIWRRVSPMIDITRHAVERLQQGRKNPEASPHFAAYINFLLE